MFYKSSSNESISCKSAGVAAAGAGTAEVAVAEEVAGEVAVASAACLPGGFQGLASLAVSRGVLPLLLGQHGFTTFLRRQHLYTTLVLPLAAATTDVLLMHELLLFLAEFLRLQAQRLPLLLLCGCAFLTGLAVHPRLGPLALLFFFGGPVGRSLLLSYSSCPRFKVGVARLSSLLRLGIILL